MSGSSRILRCRTGLRGRYRRVISIIYVIKTRCPILRVSSFRTRWSITDLSAGVVFSCSTSFCRIAATRQASGGASLMRPISKPRTHRRCLSVRIAAPIDAHAFHGYRRTFFVSSRPIRSQWRGLVLSAVPKPILVVDKHDALVQKPSKNKCILKEWKPFEHTGHFIFCAKDRELFGWLKHGDASHTNDRARKLKHFIGSPLIFVRSRVLTSYQSIDLGDLSSHLPGTTKSR